MSAVQLIRASALAGSVPYAYAATAPADARLVFLAGACPLDDVISTRVLVASSDRADLVAAWDVVHAAFGDHDVPSTLLGVTVLGYPDQLVEVEAVAALVD